MFGTFILGLIAGWAAPYAEGPIRSVLGDHLPDDLTLAEKDWPLLSLALCILAAAIVAALLTKAYGVPLALGASLGVVAPKLVEKWRSGKAPDYDS